MKGSSFYFGEKKADGRAAVLYHYPCSDGVFAALAVKMALGEENIVFLPFGPHIKLSPMEIREKIPFDVNTLHLLDYCGPSNAFLVELCRYFERVVLIDHHKTAASIIVPICPSNLIVNISTCRSACMLTLDYFFNQKSPTSQINQLFHYIEDHDMYWHKLPNSEAFAAGLFRRSIEYDPNKNPGVWNTLINLRVEELVEEGTRELQRQANVIQELLDNFVYAVILPGDIKCLAVNNADPGIRSALGHEMAKRNTEGHISAVCREEGGNWCVSLRSVDFVDTTFISKQFGGGGHRNASGFTIDRNIWESWKI